MVCEIFNTYPLAVALEAATPDALVVAILMTGERIPVIRLKLLASASPVPRCGAGKTCYSGKDILPAASKRCRCTDVLTSGV